MLDNNESSLLNALLETLFVLWSFCPMFRKALISNFYIIILKLMS